MRQVGSVSKVLMFGGKTGGTCQPMSARPPALPWITSRWAGTGESTLNHSEGGSAEALRQSEFMAKPRISRVMPRLPPAP